MNDSVAFLRSRWTPEARAEALRFLQGQPVAHPVPVIEQQGKTQFDLRGLQVEQAQLDEVLIKNVNLRWATFRDVGFKGAQLVKCNLSQTAFADCYFRRARIQRCDAVSARFDGCDFSHAQIESSRLDFAAFRNCEIRLQDISFRDDARPEVLARVCRNLKLNVISMGHYADAGDLAFMEQTFERHALWALAFKATHESTAQRTRAVARWLGSLLLGWTWGYGEKPARLALAILFNILAFGTLQYWLDAIPGKGWWEHAYFSGITFLTIGYGDVAPVGFLPRLVAVLEGVAGIATLGMLIASATKKIMYR